MSEEKKKRLRTIRVDEDALEVMFLYDDQWKVWIGQYPFFKEEPRYTPSGKPWRNVSFTGCRHNTNTEYNDCGSCECFVREQHTDLIGVCFHRANQKQEVDAG